MAPSGNACAAMTGTPLVTSMAGCELCNQYEPTKDMLLFRVKDKRLVHTSDRQWELKAGIRHICSRCIKEIQGV
jgi:hypothetical protein